MNLGATRRPEKKTHVVSASQGDGPGSDPEDPRLRARHVRVHEAGHAVVGHAVGLNVDHVIGKLTGHVSAVPPGDLKEYARTLALAAYFAAGNAAEEVILGAARADHGKADLAEIEKLRKAYPEWSADIDKSVAMAKELVELYRGVIEDLAERLQVMPPTVRGADLARFLDRVKRLPPCHPPEGGALTPSSPVRSLPMRVNRRGTRGPGDVDEHEAERLTSKDRD